MLAPYESIDAEAINIASIRSPRRLLRRSFKGPSSNQLRVLKSRHNPIRKDYVEPAAQPEEESDASSSELESRQSEENYTMDDSEYLPHASNTDVNHIARYSKMESLLREWNRTPMRDQSMHDFINSITTELMHSTTTNLERLNIRNAPFTVPGLSTLLTTLDTAQPPRLNSISIKYGKIDDHMASLLSDYITRNSNLTNMNLDFNVIGPSGARHLSNALRQNNVLTSLSLHSNRIGDEGLGCIVEVLMIHPSMKSLNVDFNHIGDDGINRLVGLIRVNQTLTSLSCDGNIFSDNTRYSLYDVIRHNTTLTFISVRFNKNCNQRYIEKLDAIMARNREYQRVAKEMQMHNARASASTTASVSVPRAVWKRLAHDTDSEQTSRLFHGQGVPLLRSNGSPRRAQFLNSLALGVPDHASVSTNSHHTTTIG
eukprot:TRINITY_DN60092_c0_g1_i2.p1 TRINITY_DN60092_c0_g1~~TRINITY_DN60092_c0_g1_i2.p1  ORF type:complete len:428 (-),score=-0.32 TRINITY_DN60092_c0_g1_i2:80-1363(-)